MPLRGPKSGGVDWDSSTTWKVFEDTWPVESCDRSWIEASPLIGTALSTSKCGGWSGDVRGRRCALAHVGPVVRTPASTSLLDHAPPMLRVRLGEDCQVELTVRVFHRPQSPAVVPCDAHVVRADGSPAAT